MPIRAICGFMMIAAMAFSIFAHAQSAKKINGSGCSLLNTATTSPWKSRGD